MNWVRVLIQLNRHWLWSDNFFCHTIKSILWTQNSTQILSATWALINSKVCQCVMEMFRRGNTKNSSMPHLYGIKAMSFYKHLMDVNLTNCDIWRDEKRSSTSSFFQEKDGNWHRATQHTLKSQRNAQNVKIVRTMYYYLSILSWARKNLSFGQTRGRGRKNLRRRAH